MDVKVGDMVFLLDNFGQFYTTKEGKCESAELKGYIMPEGRTVALLDWKDGSPLMWANPEDLVKAKH